MNRGWWGALGCRSQKRCGGATLVEFLLLAPFLVVALLFSCYLVEVAYAKLKLQEAARCLAWELTAHPLSDYGPTERADTRALFERARETVRGDVLAWYGVPAPLDSHTVSLSSLKVALENGPANLVHPVALPVPSGFGAGLREAVAFLRPGLASLLDGWQLNGQGRIRARVSSVLSYVRTHEKGQGEERWLGLDLAGPASVGALALSHQVSLVVDGWAVGDGRDATVVADVPRAGVHRSGGATSGLYNQVRRMSFLGSKQTYDRFGAALGQAQAGMAPFLPDFTGTFVVAHNYGLGKGQDCPGMPGYPAAYPSAGQGLRSLRGLTDTERPTCFDTLPFRDTEQFSTSAPARLFVARGPYFLGGKLPERDDPTEPLEAEE